MSFNNLSPDLKKVDGKLTDFNTAKTAKIAKNNTKKFNKIYC